MDNIQQKAFPNGIWHQKCYLEKEIMELRLIFGHLVALMPNYLRDYHCLLVKERLIKSFILEIFWVHLLKIIGLKLKNYQIKERLSKIIINLSFQNVRPISFFEYFDLENDDQINFL
mgnify:CR=1 FL=1